MFERRQFMHVIFSKDWHMRYIRSKVQRCSTNARIDELIKRTLFQICKDFVELAHSATSKTARVLHGAMYSKPAQDSPAADLAAAPAAPAAAAPDAAGDAGGDGADSPTGRRPGYKQQLDPGRQQMHPDVGRARMGQDGPGWARQKNGKYPLVN